MANKQGDAQEQYSTTDDPTADGARWQITLVATGVVGREHRLQRGESFMDSFKSAKSRCTIIGPSRRHYWSIPRTQ
jgi:hypothetical protein